MGSCRHLHDDVIVLIRDGDNICAIPVAAPVWNGGGCCFRAVLIFELDLDPDPRALHSKIHSEKAHMDCIQGYPLYTNMGPSTIQALLYPTFAQREAKEPSVQQPAVKVTIAMHKAVVEVLCVCTCGLAGASFLVALRRFLPLAGGGCSGASAAARFLLARPRRPSALAEAGLSAPVSGCHTRPLTQVTTPAGCTCW